MLILLALILLSNLGEIYLLYKLLSPEKKEEVLRKIPSFGSEAKVMEWTPPKAEEEVVFEETLKRLKL